jgi:hypothetical protein
VLFQLELPLSNDRKLRLYSKAWLCPSVGTVVDQQYIDEDIFFSQHSRKPNVGRTAYMNYFFFGVALTVSLIDINEFEYYVLRKYLIHMLQL